MSNRYDPDSPWREQPSRDSESRDSESRDPREQGRFRDAMGRREDRYGQTNQRRDDDYSASDYRSSRYTPDQRHDARNPSQRQTRHDPDESSSYSGSPYYGAGYSGPGGQGSFSGRSAERSPLGERYPNVRGVYQEQVWSRDPRTGELHGYDFEARWPAGDANNRAARSRSEIDPGQRDTGSNRWGAPDNKRNFGQYGKGPKGYVRSDERIREDVCDRLSDDDELDASEITVNVSGGEVRLEGTVLDRHSKHRAEDVAEAVSGVRDVTNNLRTRKGFLQEIGDKLSGDDKSEHRGHAGSGTHTPPNQNSTVQNPPTQNSALQNSTKGGLSANR